MAFFIGMLTALGLMAYRAKMRRERVNREYENIDAAIEMHGMREAEELF